MRSPVKVYELLAVPFGFGALMMLIVGIAQIVMQVHKWLTTGVWEPDPADPADRADPYRQSGP